MNTWYDDLSKPMQQTNSIVKSYSSDLALSNRSLQIE